MANIRRSIAKRLRQTAHWLWPHPTSLPETAEDQPAAAPRQLHHGRLGLTLTAEKRFMSEEVALTSRELQTLKPVNEAQFDAAARRAMAGMSVLKFGTQEDYLAAHRARFVELDNLAVVLTAKAKIDTPKVLDVGMSINTLVLRELLPRASLIVFDRPGVVVPPNYPIGLYTGDLTDPALDDLGLRERFDVILFAEVIEHLLADPVRVLRFFLRHLTPNGRLVVTTPNFFSRDNLNKMRARINPQPVFKPEYTRETASIHHVREYAMSELLEMGEAAGACPVGFFYSDCWDTDLDLSEEERLNLVVVLGQMTS
jgi:SAM-dependent methyltransferase